MEPRGKFVRVRCECKNEQVIFDRASTPVKCLVCDKALAETKGGKAKVIARVLEQLK
jgi:small subunit ribosomal protein S27e